MGCGKSLSLKKVLGLRLDYSLVDVSYKDEGCLLCTFTAANSELSNKACKTTQCVERQPACAKIWIFFFISGCISECFRGGEQ